MPSPDPLPQDAPNRPSLIARLVAVFRQFLKFGIVGASGVVVNMLVAFVMNKLNGGAANARNPVFALPWGDLAVRYSYIVFIVAFVIANTWNYQLNRRWTFKGTHRAWWRGFVMFFGAGIVGALVGFIVKVALTHPGSPLYLPGPPDHPAGWFTDSGWRAREYWGQFVGVLVGTPVNFVVNRLVTFRHYGADAAAATQTKEPSPGGARDA